MADNISNDMMILITIASIMIVVGVALPFIRADFQSDVSTVNQDKILDETGQNFVVDDTVSAIDMLASVGAMFFWGFAGLPLAVDLIFVILKILFYVTLARNIWIGGGS